MKIFGKTYNLNTTILLALLKSCTVLRTEMFAFALICMKHTGHPVSGNLTTVSVALECRMINEELHKNHVEETRIPGTIPLSQEH
jgi:hypothetical protein